MPRWGNPSRVACPSRLRASVRSLRVCDANADSVVNLLDINAIFAARNVKTFAGDPRDADGDGIITVNDGRVCTLRCDKPRCAL